MPRFIVNAFLSEYERQAFCSRLWDLTPDEKIELTQRQKCTSNTNMD